MVITKQMIRDKVHFLGPISLTRLYDQLDLKSSTEAKTVLNALKELLEERTIDLTQEGKYVSLVELES